MTKKERFITAVRGETPDMVPVAPLVHARFANAMLGRYELKDIFEVHRQIGSVHHRGPINAHPLTNMPDGYSAVTRTLPDSPYGGTINETVITTPIGSLTEKDAHGMIPHDPLVGKTVEYPVKTADDWQIALDYKRTTLDNAVAPHIENLVSAFEMMGDDGVASVALWPGYSAVASACGMQQFMLEIFDRPALMEELLEIERHMLDLQIDSFLAAPNEVAWLDICWSTGSQLGPQLFREWSLPDVNRAMDRVRAVPGKYLGLYTLGPIAELLPMFIDAGVDFVSTFEPNGGDISLAEGKQLYGDKTCIAGNFDCNILAFGTLDDARKEARRCLGDAMTGGGYVMVTGDEVPANTKLDNLKAMVEVAAKHGRY
jgi:uroporphyrinogen-III decarboxylase